MTKHNNALSLWKKHKIEIIISIIASTIFTVLCQIVRKVPVIGKSVIETIINYVYSSSSVMDEQALVILFITISIFFAITYVLSSSIVRIITLNKEDEKVSLKEENPEKEIQMLSKKIAILRRKIKKSSFKLIAMTLLLSVHLSITIITPAIINMKFKNDLTVIKPYTDNKTFMMLESDWTRMKSKDDYDKIYDTINRIKDENNLPKK